MARKTNRELVGEFVYIQPRGKSGIYTAEMQYKGSHLHRTLRTRNRKVARRRALHLERHVLEGLNPTMWGQMPARETILLSTAIKDFITFNHTQRNRYWTVRRYQGTLTKFAAFLEEQNLFNLSEIDLPVIDRYRSFRNPDLKPKSMYHEAMTLKRFFKWCAQRKHIEVSPLEGVMFPQPKKKKGPVLTLEEVDSILAAATTVRAPVMAMLALTGMRSGEARNLLAEDVDLDGNWIRVVSRPNAPTKTGEDWKVPLHPRLRAILAARPKPKSGYYFTAEASTKYPDGKHHINTKKLNEDFLAILRKLKLPAGREVNGFTIHSLRHFFKTFCINAKIPKPVVDEWQGHNLDETPSDGYYHPTDDVSQKMMLDVPFGTGKPAADAGE